jgi:hypothetical protein
VEAQDRAGRGFDRAVALGPDPGQVDGLHPEARAGGPAERWRRSMRAGPHQVEVAGARREHGARDGDQ